MDQFESMVPGHLYTSRGKSKLASTYKGGCIFVDHGACHQIGFTAEETIHSKMHFENWASNQGALVGKYTTDNGIFVAPEFTSEITAKVKV